MPRPLRIFLCHASQDKPAVRELYNALKTENWIDPWLDEEKLSFGQHWTTVIEDALEDADVVLIFLSHNSVQKEGFVQRELNYAWELSLEKPRESIFLIPFRLDDCEVPRFLRSRQWGDYFGDKRESTYQILLRSLKLRYEQKLNLEMEMELESAEKEKREADQKAMREKLQREQLERDAAEKAALEKAKREAKQKAEREAAERAAREKARREQMELEAAEKAKHDEKFGALPVDTVELLVSSNTRSRTLGIQDLSELLDGKHPVLARAAEDKLREIAAGDDSLSLRKTASEILAKHGLSEDAGQVSNLTNIKNENLAAKKKVGRVSNPTVSAPRERQVKSPIYPAWAIGLFALLVISLLIWGVSQLTPPQATPEPQQTDISALTVSPVATEIFPTYTALPVATEIPPTYTAAPPTMTPSLGIGSLYDSDGVTMLYVPAGTFSMGSEVSDDGKPIHPVDLAAYYIDKFEVTNAAYKRCVDAGACAAPKKSNSSTRPAYYGNPEFDEYPVIYVDWNMAKTYCEWHDARLPTEAEWEKAARGTDGRTYPWGESIDCEKANYQSSCAGDTKQVGSYLGGVSPYGTYDMAGNVWEWVNDWYDGTYYQNSPSSNPLGPDTGSSRVLRGGSWGSGDGSARSADRDGNDPAYTYVSFGFRCSRSP